MQGLRSGIARIAPHHPQYIAPRRSIINAYVHIGEFISIRSVGVELAVESQSRYIVTYNKKDFKGSDKFGIKTLNPVEFLKEVDLI